MKLEHLRNRLHSQQPFTWMFGELLKVLLKARDFTLLKKLKRNIMKISDGFKIPDLILVAAFFAALGFGTSAFPQVQHAYLIDLNKKTATDIGALGVDTYASSINDAGQVVGTFGPFGIYPAYQYHAFITGPNGVGMRDLGLGGWTSYANGINNTGQVVGSFRPAGDTRDHAFITGPNGVGIGDLGSLGGGYSEAYGINDAGQVVGNSSPTYNTVSYNSFHAFITGPNGVGMKDLGPWAVVTARLMVSTMAVRLWEERRTRLMAPPSMLSSLGLMGRA